MGSPPTDDGPVVEDPSPTGGSGSAVISPAVDVLVVLSFALVVAAALAVLL